MNCEICNQELPKNYNQFCSTECSSKKNRMRKYKRVCECGTVDFVAKQQMDKKCRSCSKFNNTSSKNMSQEARRKISEKKKGHTPWNKGKRGIYSKETKRKMGEDKRGKTHTEEEKKKISEGVNEYYKHYDGPNKGKNLSRNHREKISKSLRELPEDVKKEINRQRSLKVRETYQHKSPEEKQAISDKIGYSNVIFTYGDLRQAFEKYGIKPLFELKEDDVKFDRSVYQDLRCYCGRVWNVYLYEILKGRTKSCGCTKSIPEKEIYDYLVFELGISEKEIKTNKRPAFMRNKELDLWLPKWNLAIEFHGLSVHSERNVFNSKEKSEVINGHKDKFIYAQENGLDLIQIFEDEWRDKEEICKSIIKNNLGMLENQISARDCEIKTVGKLEKEEFFNQNHINGDVASKKAWGLYKNGKIVCCLSVRNPYTKDKGDALEIARFSSSLNTSVRGGFQKLLKRAIEFAGQEGYKRVVSYSDCRFGKGEVYEKAGFDFVSHTKPNYFYENKVIRQNRFKHRKNNDPSFIQNYGATEKEQNANLGWYAIYDAGNFLFQKLLD